MPIEQVLVATALPRLLASVRRQAKGRTIGELIRNSGVWDRMKARGIRSTGHNVVVYWDEAGCDLLHSAAGVPVDIGAEVTERFMGDSDLNCTETPAGRFVSTLHIGRYDRLGDAYKTIFAYCRSEGFALAGPYWEFYGHWNADPEKMEVTVSCLLA